MAPRSVWKGSLRFGLAMIPVSVTSGIENNKGIEFRQIHTADGARIRFRKFCEGCGEAIPPEEQGKGYERDDGTIIAMDDEDFESLPLATGKTLDVLQFSPADQIGPELTDRLYYLHPGDGADKAFIELLGSEQLLDEKRQKRADARAKKAEETRKAMEEQEANQQAEAAVESESKEEKEKE